MNKNENNILIAGVPRSGTTWTAEILAQAKHACYIHEPDNTKNNLMANYFYRKLHRMPYLRPSFSDKSFYEYWNYIFNKNVLPNNYIASQLLLFLSELLKKITGKHLILKPHLTITRKLYPSFNERYKKFITEWSKWYYNSKEPIRIIKANLSSLILPYLEKNFQPKILIVFRHPANVISSYLKMKMPDSNRKIYEQKSLVKDYLSPYIYKIKALDHPLQKMGVQVAIFYYVWEQQLKNYKNWITIKHEELCLDTVNQFKKLYKKLDLKWTVKSKSYIKERNKKGEGYITKRKSDNLVNKWKRVLSQDQIKHIRKGYSILPLKHYNEFQS